MALSVSIGSDGRISRGTNVVIPPENAGVGDLIYGTRSDFRVVGRGTANAGTIGGRALFGGIYGFVAGMAMVVAPLEKGGLAWLSSGSSSVGPTPTKSPLMRNGKSHTYAQMNTARNAGYITGGSAQPSDGLLTSAYQATNLTASTYAASANAETKKRFGSWTEYIRQTLRVNGAPGTPFGITTTGVKVHEFGRWMTAQIEATHGSAAAAAHACYIHGEGNGAWWLPSMFELGELMIDEHLNKLNENNISGSWDDISAASSRWSCVRYSTGLAWLSDAVGVSNNLAFTLGLAVRPVTLFKLV